MSYQSAHDLPSFVEMKRQLQGLRALSLFSRKQRETVKDIEQQIKFLGDTVDQYYKVLGPRNWIFHDTLPITDIRALLDEHLDVGELEAALIALYNDPDNLRRMIAPLNQLPAMRKRMALINRADEDYFAGRYYACIHVLLSVMDGFVNEFETVRRGLHAREAEELHAWDSVVGHHMGLANAHRTFTKGKSATNEEPVFELYRNGIVHGSILNYDNVVVATKAWNRLFAAADWAQARIKEQKPPPEKPSWKELFTLIAKNEKITRANEAWQPSTLHAGESAFTEHPASVLVDEFLTAWVAKNYGRMAQAISTEVRQLHGNAMPRLVRLEYKDLDLTSYEVTAIDHTAPAVCLIAVALHFADGSQQTVNLRWLYEDADGQPIPASLLGVWRLRNWGPMTFMNATA
ncbi:hypothetical protein ACIBCP_27145 [Streptomyces sp. NPDC051287]|uniref:hypothetical protein n=1 Tax=Streptomyces sp. NPDC051287 TaxID=3365648 RepID=UPI003789A96D